MTDDRRWGEEHTDDDRGRDQPGSDGDSSGDDGILKDDDGDACHPSQDDDPTIVFDREIPTKKGDED